MKVSIVVPVYNGEETLNECLEAILNINYPKSEYEVVVVNDASRDSSKNIILKMKEKFKSRGLNFIFLDFKENKGRIEARLAGAKKSSFDNLLFVDHRGEIDPLILRRIKKKNYEPIIGNLYQDPSDSIISRFFYVFRDIIYKPYFGKNYPEAYINKENFGSIAKGFNPFFCNRRRFFDSIPENRGKWVNDDTLIFSKIIEKKEILKSSEILCYYRERVSFREFFEHLNHRGPRFVDFYWNYRSKYFYFLLLILLSPLLLAGIIFLLKIWSIYLIGALFLTSLGYLFLNGCSFLDAFSIFIVGPLVYIAFGTGVYKGVFMKILKKK